VQLGFLPRLTIRHTSREAGQVYVPAVNWGIFVAVVALVVGFGSSQHLAAAYGIAVTGTLAIDTVLFFVVVHILWKKSLGVSIAGAAAFLTVDLAFFAANVPKVQDGGWFPLLIAALVFIVLTTWQKGREIVTKKRTELEGPLQAFVEELRDYEQPLERVPRTGIFLDANPDTAPLALRANVEHNSVLHKSVVIVQVQTLNVPHVAEEERVSIDDLGYEDDGITHVTARFGFQDDLDVPRTLRKAAERFEGDVDFGAVSYFLSRISIVVGRDRDMAIWRKKLFVAIARNAASPVPYFHLPDDRTIVMASHVEL
jgi:KUP system potassium uptake protein